MCAWNSRPWCASPPPTPPASAPCPDGVTHISPDTITDASGSAHYRVRIVPERDAFERHGHRYGLVPGVQVTCSIVTGQRSVLVYLLDPFVAAAGEALRER